MKGFSFLSLKIFDYFIIILAVASAAALSFYVYGNTGTQASFVIKSNSDTWIFPIDAEEHLHIEGPLGITSVEISDGKAWVSSSPCKNQTCVSSGKIGFHAQWIACLPNLVFLSVEGNVSVDDIDAGTW